MPMSAENIENSKLWRAAQLSVAPMMDWVNRHFQ
tara:strand:- start:106 stop:207 length:102 start_codon:yes stop_codon:yes gene_type:complete